MNASTTNPLMVPRPVQGDGPDRLKAWRKAKGLSQAALGELIGASQATVSDLENGKVVPSLALAESMRSRCRVAVSSWRPPPKKPRARAA